METAQGSIDVGLPLAEAHQKWQEFTGDGSPGSAPAISGDITEPVPDTKLGDGEKGTAYFHDLGSGSRITMELRYNPAVAQKEGLSPDWFGQRINQYLGRYQSFAEGKR
ncbi:MAG: hypothetical protein QOC87_2089 [Actinomycetota bacterium]|jgi:hypothetical protein|nr:hypothetical protein [Actinomycetota bacterium]